MSRRVLCILIVLLFAVTSVLADEPTGTTVYVPLVDVRAIGGRVSLDVSSWGWACDGIGGAGACVTVCNNYALPVKDVVVGLALPDAEPMCKPLVPPDLEAGACQDQTWGLPECDTRRDFSATGILVTE